MGVIYQIRNIVTGKVYIGSSINPHERQLRHLSNLRCGNHCNGHLQSAFNKYGEASFTFTILDSAEKDDLDEKEKEWIGKYVRNGKIDDTQCYNIEMDPKSRKGSYCMGFVGKVHTADTKAKISAANTGRAVSAATRKKLSDKGKGRKLSPEHAETLRQVHIGSKRSPETKDRIRQKALGRKHSDATKEKIAKIGTGRTHSEETKQKMRESRAKILASGWKQNVTPAMLEALRQGRKCLEDKHKEAKSAL